MSMQWRKVEIVGKPKFEYSCWFFGSARFARTGAIRFRFLCGYSETRWIATGFSVPGFRFYTCSTGSVDSPRVSVSASVIFGQIPGSITCVSAFARLWPGGSVRLSPVFVSFGLGSVHLNRSSKWWVGEWWTRGRRKKGHGNPKVGNRRRRRKMGCREKGRRERGWRAWWR